MTNVPELTILGNTVRHPIGAAELETFAAPPHCSAVRFETNEWTSLCPVTGQPDFGTLSIYYVPNDLCVESKSLKLWLWSFRDQAHFVEQLAAMIAVTLGETLQAQAVTTEVKQNVRGGIVTTASGRWVP